MSVVRAFLCALSFLTRFPVARGQGFHPGAAGGSVAFFPLVGLFLGAASAGLAWTILEALRFPPHPAWALLIVAVHAFLTGALHLDGLSDVVDGLGAGDRERALEVMKDPRIGAFGVVALLIHLMAKVIVLGEVLHLEGRLAVLFAFPMVARMAVVPLVVLFPCARPTGLARTFHDESRWPSVLIAAAFTACAVVYLNPALAGAAGIALGVSLATGLWIALRIRGLTGDAYGAAIELAELAFLVVAAFPRIRGG